MLFHQVQIKEKGEKRKSTEQVTRSLLTIVVRNKLRNRNRRHLFFNFFSVLKDQGKERKEKERKRSVIFFQNVVLTHITLLCLCLHVCILQL